MNRTISVGVALMVVVAAVSGCTSVMQPIENRPLRPLAGATVEQVGEAVFLAIQRRKWQARKIAPGHIEAQYTKWRHKVVVDVIFDTKKFSIRYKDSENMRFSGGTIHNRYNEWTGKLADLISARVRNTMEKTRTYRLTRPSAQPLERIGLAVRSGGERRRWQVTPVRPGEAVAVLDRGRVYVKIRINYDSRKVSVTYLESRGLRYNGVRIHWKYGKWVGELMDTIDLHIRRL